MKINLALPIPVTPYCHRNDISALDDEDLKLKLTILSTITDTVTFYTDAGFRIRTQEPLFSYAIWVAIDHKRHSI